MNQEKIGHFIAEKRKEKNMTQLDLAEKLGVTDRSISNWENGKNMPDLSLFKDLCAELDISINELISGEEIAQEKYLTTLEENFVSMVSSLEKRKKRKYKIFIFIVILFFITYITGYIIYDNYEMDVKYDERVMTCEINDSRLRYIVKGQSTLNTYHTIKQLDDKKIYFIHSTVNLRNKKRSHWEYFHSMARLLEDKNIVFQTWAEFDITGDKVEVYYTDKSLKEIQKASNKELKEIIANSYFMCNN